MLPATSRATLLAQPTQNNSRPAPQIRTASAEPTTTESDEGLPLSSGSLPYCRGALRRASLLPPKPWSTSQPMRLPARKTDVQYGSWACSISQMSVLEEERKACPRLIVVGTHSAVSAWGPGRPTLRVSGTLTRTKGRQWSRPEVAGP